MNRLLPALLAILVAAAGTCAIVHAQPALAPGESLPFVPNIVPTLHISRAAGGIEIDGELNDAGWAGAARASNFSESYPNHQAEPPVKTEALVTYDDANLYVAIICHDDPESIRATLHDRDEMWNEDMAGIILDTYGEANLAYEIFTNARGVQGDLLWTTSSEDSRFDLVFSSQSRITSQGYQVEMAIPFSSLRFPNRGVQTWRATFWRIHPRDSRREYTWAAIDPDNSCQFCQYGILTGIENVKPGGALELLPSVVGYQAATLGEVNPPQLENGPVKGDAGLGIRYAFTPSVIGELTLNPDFSQVESDAAQIDVNSTFALSYPEKRPFFQEGSDLFSTFISAVYTRTINDPLVATKLTGRLGGTNLAYLGAYDENTPLIIPGEESSRLIQGGKTLSNIFRARQSFAQESYLGVILTDMRLGLGEESPSGTEGPAGSGTTFGADALFKFFDVYQLEWQSLASRMAEPGQSRTTSPNSRPTQAFDGETFWGQAHYVSLERNSRYWNFDFDYWDTDQGFRSLNGFTTEAGMRTFSGWTGVTTYPELSWVDRMTPSITVGRQWDTGWIQKDEWIIPALEFNLKGQSWVKVSYLISRELFRGVQFDSIRRFDLHASTYFSNAFGGGFDITVGRSIARNLERPVLGRGSDIGIFATIKPMQRFNIQPTFNYASLYHPDTGEEIFAGYVLRTRLNYQFTRELFLRLVVQYDDFSKGVAVEPLLTYKINPFTIFYVGSTHDFAEFENPGASPRYSATGRQFFAKFQYLVQI